MNRTCKILPLLLLLLPVLATAQTTRDSNDNKRDTGASPSASALRTAATSTGTTVQAVKANSQDQANDKRRQPYVETPDDERRYLADSQDSVLVSEICTYSQYTYTYTCK